MTDLDCYEPKPVAPVVAKAPAVRPFKPLVAKRRVPRKPLFLKDKREDEIYPCDSPSLPPLVLAPLEPEASAEFTPIPFAFVEPVLETFETASSGYATPFYVPGGYAVGGYVLQQASPIPEPSTLALLGVGLLLLGRRVRVNT